MLQNRKLILKSLKSREILYDNENIIIKVKLKYIIEKFVDSKYYLINKNININNPLSCNSLKEISPREFSLENISININNEILFDYIENYLKKGIYTITNNKEKNNNLNKKENTKNKDYNYYKENMNKLDIKELNNEEKILYDNFQEFIKFINKIEKIFSFLNTDFNIILELCFHEIEEKGNGSFKNINCEYKIKTIDLKIGKKQIFQDKDILNNDQYNKNTNNFISLLNDFYFKKPEL